MGVIIAFYFTKYGERLNRNQDEKEVLNQIYFELQDNLIDLRQDLLIHQIGLEANLRVLKFLDTKGPLTDSLVMDFYWMTKDEYIFGNTSGYENLKSFGIGLIKDDYLRNLITLVYNHNFPRLIKGNTLYPDINEFLNPYFKDHFKVNRDTSLKYTLNLNDSIQVKYPREIGFGVQKFVGYIPMSTEELLVDEEFRFLINKTLEYRLYKFQFYQRCIENVKKTIEQIELSQ
ncbi:MAG: hypothetical protein Sapg2KO_49000 [Saprospiraceae bacterium]